MEIFFQIEIVYQLNILELGEEMFDYFDRGLKFVGFIDIFQVVLEDIFSFSVTSLFWVFCSYFGKRWLYIDGFCKFDFQCILKNEY